MKKIKQKRKKQRKNPSKTTIVPKMSAARQNYIKRFRRNLIRKANQHLRQTLRANPIIDTDDLSGDERERRVRFDEDSNQTYENPRWIDQEDVSEHEDEAWQPTIKEKQEQDDSN